ncbi:hypothetical protein [Pseudomonas sp. v388]|uniref:hypothetical protein n=1 Tax=Pseudomonas sp. v388 TaxID=2479849 RepID=UPI000F7AF522|nr:hypothetical protein [Pseudomonas sp. v388]
MGEMMQFGPFIMRAVTEWDAQFKNGLSLIDSSLSQELGAARGGRPENISTVEGIQRELDLRHQLSERRRSEIQQLSSAADQFYGGDPLALTLHQQVNKAILRMGRSRNQEEIYRLAQASHEAAYKRRFPVEALGRLNQQTAALRARLANVQRAQAEAAARAAAQRAQAEAAARAAAQRAQAEAAARAAAQRAQAEAAARAEAERAQAEAAARA